MHFLLFRLLFPISGFCALFIFLKYMFCFPLVLGIEFMLSSMLDKCPIIEIHPEPVIASGTVGLKVDLKANVKMNIGKLTCL
jgi:hypothetical protein